MFVLLRKHSIRLQLLFIGVVILLILSVTVVWSYQRILQITYKRNSDYTLELMAAIKRNIVSNADTINRILPNIAYSEPVQEYLLEQDRLKQFELHGRIETQLVNLTSMNQGILDVVLIGTNGNTYNCINCHEYIPVGEIPERTYAYYSGVRLYPYSNPMKHVVYVGAPIYDKRNDSTGQKIGYVVMVLDVNAIAPRMDEMSSKIAGNFYVLDRNLVVSASNDVTKIGKMLPELQAADGEEQSPHVFRRDGNMYVSHMEPIPEIGGKIVTVFPVKELFRGLEDVQKLVVGIFVLLIVVMYAFYIAISRNILQPIRSFMTFVYALRAKGLDHPNKRLSLEGYAEISIMARQFNALLDEIDDLTGKLIDSRTRIYELQLHKKQAELQFLKSQINPHFLYNALETIKGIAYAKDVPEIREMTDALSRMFRYSVKGGDYVLLKEEIETVEAYISIQQIRFDGRFDVCYEFDENCRDLTVLKMILQPLVENAVFHGIEPSLKKCRLTVGCRIDENGDLLLWVSDDGAGMDADTLDKIRNRLGEQAASREWTMSAQRHIGILNVNSRIKFAYGDAYGIVGIESASGEGTRVTVKIPAKRGGEHV